MPRRSRALHALGYAHRSGYAPWLEARGERGAQPSSRKRLTSGGEAAA